MLELIRRDTAHVAGYRECCREIYSSGETYFRPTDPEKIDESWFERTKKWYDDREKGLVPGKPVSFHYWAVDGDAFIGEFQLRTELTELVMNGIGSVGYAVRVSRRRMGYGTELLRQGLEIARERGLDRVLLNINDKNTASIRLCERFGGVLRDAIPAENPDEGKHILRRYWIYL